MPKFTGKGVNPQLRYFLKEVNGPKPVREPQKSERLCPLSVPNRRPQVQRCLPRVPPPLLEAGPDLKSRTSVRTETAQSINADTHTFWNSQSFQNQLASRFSRSRRECASSKHGCCNSVTDLCGHPAAPPSRPESKPLPPRRRGSWSCLFTNTSLGLEPWVCRPWGEGGGELSPCFVA